MLDFYLIRDDQATPDYPELGSLEQVGGLDEKCFKMLKDKGVIPGNFDYYTDFRWDTSSSKRILEHIQEGELKTNSCVENLVRLLERAAQHKCGLIAYSD